MSHNSNRNPQLYFDLSVDGKPSERVVLQFTGAHDPYHATTLPRICKDASVRADNIFGLSTLKVFHLSKSLSQEVDTPKEDDICQKHNDLCSKEIEAYVWLNGGEPDSFCVVFTHMHFLNWCYPVQAYTIIGKGFETFQKIRQSTEPIEITGFGEFCEDEKNQVPESDKGKTDNNGKGAEQSNSDLDLPS